MPILSIEHVTSYRYYQPVAFGEHRMMLRPRDDDDQKVLQCQLEIRPKPRELAWGKDKLGNHVAIAYFADRSDELRVVSTICLEHAPNGFYEADITDYARIYPFSYIAEDWSRLRRFILPLSLEPELRLWSDQFFRNGSDTHGLLVDMTSDHPPDPSARGSPREGNPRSDSHHRPRERQLPRPRDVNDGGAALARNCGAVCFGLLAFGRRGARRRASNYWW